MILTVAGGSEVSVNFTGCKKMAGRVGFWMGFGQS
jgi:hypothetical protein